MIQCVYSQCPMEQQQRLDYPCSVIIRATKRALCKAMLQRFNRYIKDGISILLDSWSNSPFSRQLGFTLAGIWAWGLDWAVGLNSALQRTCSASARDTEMCNSKAQHPPPMFVWCGFQICLVPSLEVEKPFGNSCSKANPCRALQVLLVFITNKGRRNHHMYIHLCIYSLCETY